MSWGKMSVILMFLTVVGVCAFFFTSLNAIDAKYEGRIDEASQPIDYSILSNESAVLVEAYEERRDAIVHYHEEVVSELINCSHAYTDKDASGSPLVQQFQIVSEFGTQEVLKVEAEFVKFAPTTEGETPYLQAITIGSISSHYEYHYIAHLPQEKIDEIVSASMEQEAKEAEAAQSSDDNSSIYFGGYGVRY